MDVIRNAVVAMQHRISDDFMKRGNRVFNRFESLRRIDTNGFYYLRRRFDRLVYLNVGVTINRSWVAIECVSSTLLGSSLVSVDLNPSAFWENCLWLFREQYNSRYRWLVSLKNLLLA